MQALRSPVAVQASRACCPATPKALPQLRSMPAPVRTVRRYQVVARALPEAPEAPAPQEAASAPAQPAEASPAAAAPAEQQAQDIQVRGGGGP